MQKVAAIDVGSNAVRLLIREIGETPSFFVSDDEGKDGVLLREPIRLGADTYGSMHRIGPEKEEALLQTLLNFRQKMYQEGVSSYRACATASLRDAENGEIVARRVSQHSGIQLEVITSEEESALVRKSYFARPCTERGVLLFADVGGGSTDVSLTVDGDVVYVHSFRLGSLNKENAALRAEEFEAVKAELGTLREQYGPICMVGSGGGIHKICKKLAADPSDDHLSTTALLELYRRLEPLSVEERMAQFQLKRDRAEVVAETLSIFYVLACSVRAKTIHAPRIGVRDGIIASLVS
ncbi:MAG: Ppx/GppA family phosphatase [Bacteroidaceae bacterium]|nr:Ppx/GppA family phosphatase [Bacteroidaceae bacterium]